MTSKKLRLLALLVLVVAGAAAYFVYSTEREDSSYKFRFGLDLQGGTHLVYDADTSGVDVGQVNAAMSSLRDVIERRVNMFGVSEPLVQVESGGVLENTERLIVELPGITDVDEAVALIGKTPLLEFRLLNEDVDPLAEENQDVDEIFTQTGLTGRFVERAQIQFDQYTSEATVALTFNAEGRELFADITRENVGRVLAIFLDGVPISTPVIRDEIRDGNAVISGGFNPEEARELVRNLNFGALPVPIELASTQTIGATLGEETLNAGILAGITGFIMVAFFVIVWYRLPGMVAVLSLAIYVVAMLAIFKIVPVTLTAAGIAGFILSIGMAVDANILIFERLKEELFKGRNTKDAVMEGFSRAWPSIRDANISSIISAIVLFWFGTSLVKGFALVFGIGVIVSMFTAITISRTLLLSLGTEKPNKMLELLFRSGVRVSSNLPQAKQ